MSARHLRMIHCHCPQELTWPEVIRDNEGVCMAVKQRQSLACVHGHCHASERQGPGCKPQGANWFHVLDFCKHVLGPRLSARLPATFTDVPCGSRTLCISAELVVPLILGAVQRWVTNCTFFCCWRKRQTSWRRCCIARSTRAAKIQITQRAASGSCPGSFHEYHWSGSVSLINRTKAIRRPNSREPVFEKCKPWDFQADPHSAASSVHHWGHRSSDPRKWKKLLGHTQPHCADASHLTLRVEGLDAVKHHARSTFPWPSGSYSPWWASGWRVVCMLYPRWAEHPRFWHLHGLQVRSSHTLTRPRLWAPCSEFHCKARKVRAQKQRENQTNETRTPFPEPWRRLHRDATVDAPPRLLKTFNALRWQQWCSAPAMSQGTHSTLCVDHSGALHLWCDSEQIQRSALTTVVFCTCDDTDDARLLNKFNALRWQQWCSAPAISESMLCLDLDYIDNSGALYLRCHSRCSASTLEHVQRFALTTVVLCTAMSQSMLCLDSWTRSTLCVDNSGAVHLQCLCEHMQRSEIHEFTKANYLSFPKGTSRGSRKGKP